MNTRDTRFEVGVPIPNRHEKYALISRLEVGESAIIPDVSISAASQAVAWRQRRYGRKFTCRTVMEGEVHGVRVWRLS
jgi:hypothetical protein